MRLIALIAVTMVVLSGEVSLAAVRRVPQVYGSIQSAVTASQQGDTVLISSGTYLEAVSIPSMGLTIAGRFLETGVLGDIDSCVIRGYTSGDDTIRAISIEDDGGPLPSCRIVGLRFATSSARHDESGGAIRVFGQVVSIEHCKFDSCKAGYGGGVGVRQSVTSISNCSFTFCGANRFGAAVRSVESQVVMDSCLIEESTSYDDEDERPEQIGIRLTHLTLINSEVRNCGRGPNPDGCYFVYASKPPDTVEISNTYFHDNHWANFIHRGGQYLDFLRIDSCRFTNERLSGAIYSQGGPDSLTTFFCRGNVFEDFTRVWPYGMHGLFALSRTRTTVMIMHNLVRGFSLGHTSLGNLFEINESPRVVSNNYILECSNESISWPPSGQVLLYRNGDTDFHYNVMQGNIGYAVFQGNLNGTSFARRNYWGHESGPYDSVGNPGGQGDTVEWRINYQPWEQDTSFLASVPEPRVPVSVPQSFIGNAYPNPFNSSVTIEFVLLKDQKISLEVFDLTGRRVATLFDERIRAGVHVRDWRPETSASGLYFARLSTDEGIRSTAKLLFIK